METEKFVSLGNVRLYVATGGAGVPVVLLGGPWFGQTYIQPIAEALSENFRTILYDPRGSGKSSTLSEGAINLKGHLADLEGLRKSLGLKRLNLLGHSLGALVVLLYAAHFPENTGALILANPGPPFIPDLMKELHQAFRHGQTEEDRMKMEAISSTEAFKARQPGAHEEFFKIMYAAFFPDRSLLDGLHFGFTEATARYALEAEERLMGEIFTLDPPSLLDRVLSPTLVVHAEKDLIPLGFSTFLANNIPEAKLVLLDGVGHFAYMENPDKFKNAVIPFLNQNAVSEG